MVVLKALSNRQKGGKKEPEFHQLKRGFSGHVQFDVFVAGFIEKLLLPHTINIKTQIAVRPDTIQPHKDNICTTYVFISVCVVFTHDTPWVLLGPCSTKITSEHNMTEKQHA